ncbi:MAG: murein L,D-transpeptidase [Nocardioidaceae bacterium]|nr:murein L,D-transpeptidase [Nocardioidaceae bacterium]
MSSTTATLATAGALIAGLLVTGASSAAGATVPAATTADASPASTPASTGKGGDWNMQKRFAREVVRYGDEDSSPRRIEHVTELQYRLRWVGAFNGPVTGYFGDLTKAAVRRFQHRVGLHVNGIANHKTWAKLIPRTVKARPLIHNKCKDGIGWHICYDRYRHQVTLWKKGNLRNSWLVRGGKRGYETRVGTFRVYMRDKDHVSGIYGTAMPYSQFFSGGQAFHGSPFMIDPWQDHSHGCVNMYIEDARQLWSMTSRVNLNVHIYGKWDRMAGPGVGTRSLDLM